MKKIIGFIIGFIVFSAVMQVFGFLEPRYAVFLPELSGRVLRNIVAGSNIAGFTLAIFLGVRTYKKIASSTPSA